MTDAQIEQYYYEAKLALKHLGKVPALDMLLVLMELKRLKQELDDERTTSEVRQS